MLTDALYFKARWATTFGKYGPVDGTFTRLDGGTVDVEFMQELELADRRGAGDGFVGAEIPYVGDDAPQIASASAPISASTNEASIARSRSGLAWSSCSDTQPDRSILGVAAIA